MALVITLFLFSNALFFLLAFAKWIHSSKA
jgi:hypothetical protein